MNHPFTHKGWYWFCPIYLAQEHGEFIVEARWAVLEPVFSLCSVLDQMRIFLTSMFDPDYEPTFMFRITGELK